MNQIFVNLIDKYKILKIDLKEKYFNFFVKKENFGFWEQWTLLHVELFKNLYLENNPSENQIIETNKHFMNKRVRMASAFLQGLKTESKEIKNESTRIFKEVLKEHDEIFKNFLSEILNHYSEELVKIQRFRKVTAAYVNSYSTTEY